MSGVSRQRRSPFNLNPRLLDNGPSPFKGGLSEQAHRNWDEEARWCRQKLLHPLTGRSDGDLLTEEPLGETCRVAAPLNSDVPVFLPKAGYIPGAVSCPL